ncbi:large ribosomal RNA subunit accumulation protein YCED homolog 2, chloroplastic isoform X2 [Macadamia integrifolia]|uniref:large ribosomal RNA subunit accumulation protein YCED homolog 2, chloroplastic isoform X2 n=1 Tax=Macadamia integrifolia TaxID=60698 RepID=UPI001C4FE8BE|nr:large ribosomal RNA subunit accumulation protein YCED homolog 2, chloroplastic isoform X2 [Macadamia integrifolia]
MEKMAKATNFLSPRNINNPPICSPYSYPSPPPPPLSKTLNIPSRTSTIKAAASRKNGVSQITRKSPKASRRLISISTSDCSKWNGKWTLDYIFTLKELKLADLAEDGQKDAEVSIALNIVKHASFGFSVDGRIITSFTRKCLNCSSPFCRKIDTTFDVWVLPSSRRNLSMKSPEIGGDDPSVIYVKPGCEADLDSLVQDTIRLNTSVKETCSETCEKSELRWQSTSGKDSSIDGRWSRLLELKNVI